jgi:hypothetical protein
MRTCAHKRGLRCPPGRAVLGITWIFSVHAPPALARRKGARQGRAASRAATAPSRRLVNRVEMPLTDLLDPISMTKKREPPHQPRLLTIHSGGRKFQGRESARAQAAGTVRSVKHVGPAASVFWAISVEPSDSSISVGARPYLNFHVKVSVGPLFWQLGSIGWNV